MLITGIWHLKRKAGDRIDFIVEPDGRVVLVPATIDVRELKGLLAPAPRRVSLDEMEAAIRRRAGR
jgi:antitoxin PrlF